ncbi:hypothetical protein ColTof4_01436 [Colletotrichum tofieldiae]|nr:hypothetical protein ColTof4_01436 [Colletotrichum tofieldiae]GKT96881.1 hypothetical protein Ct61P_14731 [Colletotrichum tofieldiae]
MHVPHFHQAVILGLVFYAVTSVAVPVPWPVDVVSKAVGIAKVDAEAQQGHAAKRRGIDDNIGDVLKRGGSGGHNIKGSGSNSGNGGKVKFDVKGNVEGGVFGGFKQGDLNVGGGDKINKESANKALLKLSNEGSNKKNTKSSTSKKGSKKPN